jgi:glycosyltransferase involved in cell wall biosynthesis
MSLSAGSSLSSFNIWYSCFREGTHVLTILGIKLRSGWGNCVGPQDRATLSGLGEGEGEQMSKQLRAARDAAATAPVVSVVVPVLNGGKDFARCLAALTTSPPGPAWELIVVDDGSTDGSPDQALAAGARVLRTPHRRSGPGVARNLGARVATGEFLFFLDADVLVTPHTITQIVDAFRLEPTITALFGSYDARPAAPNFLSQYKNLFHHFVHQTSWSDATTFWSGCGAIRRTVFLEFGGFNPGYGRPSIEDIELGYRLTRAGHAVRLCHDIQVTHLKRWTVRSLILTDIRDRGIPWTQLMLRGRVFNNDLNLNTANRLSVACAGLLWATLLAAPVWPVTIVGALLLALFLLSLNRQLFRFFSEERGLRFALATIPWVWLYYTYSGLCVVLGAWAHLRSRRQSASRGRRFEAVYEPEPGIATDTASPSTI